ncbi:MAG TPA: hypothetical protein VNF47_04560 [Streptosporangiaceae bacterium]|nr:hypothetical protein [Streptosporangiaceae bacterium]
METYQCTVWYEPQGWLAGGPQQIESFNTALDLDDPRSMQAALTGAAYRHRGRRADLYLYGLEVRWPGEKEVLRLYRYQQLLGEDGG